MTGLVIMTGPTIMTSLVIMDGPTIMTGLVIMDGPTIMTGLVITWFIGTAMSRAARPGPQSSG